MRAFQCIAEADKYVERANSTQNYTWWRYAGALAEEVANVRITEPYHYINKSYPKARRNRRIKSTYDNSKAVLYREVKNQDFFTGCFSFREFKKDILPILKESSEDEKMNMILTYDLSDDAMKALNIPKKKYEDWLSTEIDEEKIEEQKEITEFEEENEEIDSVFDI